MAQATVPVLITMDCEWAPDWALERAFAAIEAAGARALVFATDPRPAIAKRLGHPAFEFGWHPNFHPGSTQGRTVPEVVEYLRAIAPGARSFRTHDLLQSTRHLSALGAAAPQLERDFSLYLPGQPELRPFDLDLPSGRRLRRYPFLWEDDLALLAGPPPGDWSWLPPAGLRIVNFHPILICLNSESPARYARAKALGDMAALREADVAALAHPGWGVGDCFRLLLSGRGGAGAPWPATRPFP